MKYLIVLSLIAAVASATYIRPTPVAAEVAQIQEIIDSINSPSTDPATAAALEQLLLQTLGLPQEPSPVSVGPAIVDFPIPDGGAVSAEPAVVAEPTPAAVVPAPVVPGEVSVGAATPLVQIILNINSAESGVVAGAPAAVPGAPAFVPGAPAVLPAPVDAPEPVLVVDQAVNPPTAVPSPVLVVEQPSVAVGRPEPVLVEQPGLAVGAPEPVVIAPAPEPIQIGSPIIPEPIVLLPDILN